MVSDFDGAEDLVRRLPLPLAKLYRHATNAKSSLERHQGAYFLFEAGLKLLAVSAVASYAGGAVDDPKIAEQLASLSRPSLGEWRKYVRLLVPLLAASDEGFAAIKQTLERSRDDLPRAAGLDALLREVIEKKAGARSTVRLNELFDRLVTYRNVELGHGASGLRFTGFYGRMERALLAGIPEILGRLDVLAGRRLVYVADVARRPNGNWLIERFELIGEMPRRMEPLELAAVSESFVPGRVYLEAASSAKQGFPYTPLYPLAIYDPGAKELLFFNTQRGRQRCDYLCYSSGEVQQTDKLSGQMGPLLSRLFGQTGDAPPSDLSASAAPSPAEESAAPDARAPFKTIGEFELLSKLGQGGMGVVYRAWQPSVGRQVALKCLLRAGDPKAAERFAREYRALGRVNDPHLVKVYTSGSEGDQWFYAMELIEGTTLAPVCQRLQSSAKTAAGVAPDTWKQAVTTSCEEVRRAEQPLVAADSTRVDTDAAPPEPVAPPPLKVESYVRQVVELIRQVATAADKLHKAGVVHRDIKPGNIMLTADGSQAVLMDLGLAQWTDTDKSASTRQFVGTLRYASPEQVLAVDRLDGRSNVYSLGATLWELLTLHPMFGATDDTPTPELMKRIQFEDAELASKYDPGIARDLEAIVAKCLEKNPADRYATAAELADDLGRWLRDEPVLAQATNWRYRAGKFVRRNRRRIALGSAAVVLQIGLIVVLYHLFVHPYQPGPLDRKSSGSVAVPKGPTVHRRALLVGCTRYDNLPEGQLAGTISDVNMVRETLINKFGMPDDDITQLTEGHGADRRPTRANVAREIDRLVESAQADEQIVVFLAGNGGIGRFPTAAAGRRPSVFRFAGLEVKPNDSPAAAAAKPPAGEAYFFPADVGRPLADGTIPSGIAGSEFAGWIQPALAAGARIWLIYDCCDGGFAAPRGLSPSVESAEQKGTVPLAPPKQTHFVATYASQPGEEEVEMRLPGDADAPACGLFTYTLCEILGRSARPLTYQELIQRVVDRYQAQGRSQPTPWAAGSGIDQPVLGGVDFSGAVNFRVKKIQGDAYTLDGGAVQGLSKGCILDVKSPDDLSQSLGHLRVTDVRWLEATAIPFEFEGVSGGPPKPIPIGAPAQLTYVDLGDLRLKVAVGQQTRAGEPLPPDAQDQLEGAVDRALRSHESLVTPVSDVQHADWVVVQESLKSPAFYLVRADEVLAPAKPGAPPSGSAVGPIPRDKLAKTLPDLLTSLARAGNLLTLARLSQGEFERGRGDLQVDVEMLRLKDAQDQVGAPLPRQGGVPLARSGDRVGWRITNHSASPVDVTLLYIESDSGIAAVFPSAGSGANNRLAPNQSLLTRRFKITATTTGLEHVVLIAAPGSGEPIDFSVLENHSWELARGATRGAGDPTFDTAVGKVFASALYGEGKQRGLTIHEIDQFPLRALSWRVAPASGR